MLLARLKFHEDNAGDNVGDIAGMVADLFGSFAEATCAALVLAASSDDLSRSNCSLLYPLLISSVGIVVGHITLLLQKILYPMKQERDVEKALKGILVINTVLMTPLVIYLSKAAGLSIQEVRAAGIADLKAAGSTGGPSRRHRGPEGGRLHL